MSKKKFIPLDRFLNYRNDTLIVEDNKNNQRILFYPDGDNKSVGLLYKGLSVLNLTIFNLTPKNFNSFKIINPITHNYVTIKRHLSENQREIFLFKIKTESCIKFVAYSVKWDLSHWSGFSSIQEEEAKEFENLRDVKNWLIILRGNILTYIQGTPRRVDTLEVEFNNSLFAGT